MKKRENKNRGITLMALVITIVVLLILAGVTIGSLTSDNGVIKEAGSAKELSEKAGLEEQIELAIIKAEQKHRNPTMEDVIEEIKKIDEKIEVNVTTGEITTSQGTITGKLDDYIAKTTVRDALIIDETNKTSSYVNYPAKNGEKILCKVLYDANSEYGLQIVSVDLVTNVKLGFDDPTIPSGMSSQTNLQKAIYSYNHAIETLNKKAEEYRNQQYSNVGGARCIGSVPDDPNSQSGYMNNNNLWYTNGNVVLDEDSNYDKDWKQLGIIGAKEAISKQYYFMASRRSNATDSPTVNVGIYINGSNYDPWLTGSQAVALVYFGWGGNAEEAYGRSVEYGFRPVFTLKSNIEVIEGDGTAENPYELK